jgi:hypothetical protein
MEALNHACQELFPVDIWNDFLSTLTIDLFVDNWKAVSMFNCPQNSNLLAPAITKLWGNLMKAIFCRNVNFQSILMCSQTFLQHFATTYWAMNQVCTSAKIL